MTEASCGWDPIDEFGSLAEYRRFHEWINDQVTSGLAAAVPVTKPYSGSLLWDEHWFKCLSDDQTWRLVRPDPPFRGIFKIVT
jgi:hypothetical protein